MCERAYCLLTLKQSNTLTYIQYIFSNIYKYKNNCWWQNNLCQILIKSRKKNNMTKKYIITTSARHHDCSEKSDNLAFPLGVEEILSFEVFS